MRKSYRLIITGILCALMLLSVMTAFGQEATATPAAEQATEEAHSEEAAATEEAHSEETAEGEEHSEEAAAEGEDHSESGEGEPVPQGMSWLMFLLGLGGVLAVGLVATRGGADSGTRDNDAA